MRRDVLTERRPVPTAAAEQEPVVKGARRQVMRPDVHMGLTVVLMVAEEPENVARVVRRVVI